MISKELYKLLDFLHELGYVYSEYINYERHELPEWFEYYEDEECIVIDLVGKSNSIKYMELESYTKEEIKELYKPEDLVDISMFWLNNQNIFVMFNEYVLPKEDMSKIRNQIEVLKTESTEEEVSIQW